MYMRKILSSLILLSLFIIPSCSYGGSIPGDVIVVLRNTSGVSISSAGSVKSLSSVQALAKSSSSTIKATYDALSERSGNVFMLLHSDTKSEHELLREVKARPDVVAASLNYEVHLTDTGKTPNDPQFWQLWGMQAINAPYAWDFSTGSGDVYVAVIDSGIDPEHEDLRGNVATEYSRNFISSDTSAYNDGNDHGTHVSGTIAAIGNNSLGVAGVNWKAKIIALRTFNADGSGQNAHTIAALDYLASLLRNNPTLNIAALNMSLGGYRSYSPEEASEGISPEWLALKAISDMNRTVICVAAGNESYELGSPNEDGEYCYPASFTGIDNMIVVAASDPDLSRAYYSNYNPNYADVAAPGSDIFSTISHTKSHDLNIDRVARVYAYGEKNGTSMATPHVTGAAALLKAIYPNATASQIKAAIVGGANGAYLRDDGTSMYGMLDLKGAVDFMAASISGNNPPKIAGAHTHEGTAGQPYILSFYASGSQPITWSIAGNLPDGLSFDNGKISGAPTKSGTSSFIVTAENSYGTDSLVLSIDIKSAEAPVISMTQDDIYDALKNVVYGCKVDLSAGSWPLSWDLTSNDFPESFGVEYDNSLGGFQFTPTETGTYTFTAKVSNSAGNDSRTFTLTVGEADAPEIVSYDINPKAARGIMYGLNSASDIAMAAMGFTKPGGTVTAECSLPVSWDVTGLPEGMSFEYGPADTGIYASKLSLIGTPQETGSYDLVITVRDAFGTDSMDFTLSVEDAPCSFAMKSGSSLFQRGLYVNNSYNVMGSPVVSFDVSGDVPPGMSLLFGKNTAMFAGVPTTTGIYRLVLTATNSAGADSIDITLTVNEPVEITSKILPDGIKGTPYSYDMATLYGVPVSWDINGDIPGLTLNPSTGRLSGTPTESGTFKPRITARASGNGYYSRLYSLNVKEAPAITGALLFPGQVGTPYSATLTATGTSPITWTVSAGRLPAGLALSSNGYIYGTPTESGTFIFSLKATNSVSDDTRIFTVNIEPDGPVEPPIPSRDIDSGKPEITRLNTNGLYAMNNGELGQLIQFMNEGGKIAAILPEISVNISGLYDYESFDLLANIAISQDIPEGWGLIWNVFTRTSMLSEFLDTEENSATFYDTSGNVITSVPDNHTVNVSAWFNTGVHYIPVILAVKSDDAHNVGGSGGGCNSGGLWLIIAAAVFLFVPGMKSLKILALVCIIVPAFSVAIASEYREGEALVVIRAPEGITITSENVNTPEVRAYLDGIAEASCGRVAAVYGSLSAAGGGHNILAFIVSEKLTTNKLVASLKKDPRVVSASPNYKVRTMGARLTE